MKFDNLIELAKAVSSDILSTEFKINKKIPINSDLNLNIELLPKDENGDLAREDPDEFMRLVNNCVAHKLNYLYEEGFLAKEKGFYRAYTNKELKKMLDDISVNDID
jgi:hypothetical protein